MKFFYKACFTLLFLSIFNFGVCNNKRGQESTLTQELFSSSHVALSEYRKTSMLKNAEIRHSQVKDFCGNKELSACAYVVKGSKGTLTLKVDEKLNGSQSITSTVYTTNSCEILGLNMAINKAGKIVLTWYEYKFNSYSNIFAAQKIADKKWKIYSTLNRSKQSINISEQPHISINEKGSFAVIWNTRSPENKIHSKVWDSINGWSFVEKVFDEPYFNPQIFIDDFDNITILSTNKFCSKIDLFNGKVIDGKLKGEIKRILYASKYNRKLSTDNPQYCRNSNNDILILWNTHFGEIKTLTKARNKPWSKITTLNGSSSEDPMLGWNARVCLNDQNQALATWETTFLNEGIFVAYKEKTGAWSTRKIQRLKNDAIRQRPFYPIPELSNDGKALVFWNVFSEITGRKTIFFSKRTKKGHWSDPKQIN